LIGLTSAVFASEKAKKAFRQNEPPKDGSWTERWENGSLRSQGSYTKGAKEGLWRTWYKNGQLQTIGTYEMGEPTGFWSTWYENGKIKLKATMDFAVQHEMNGMKKGWKFWTEEGEPVVYETWLPKTIEVAEVETKKTAHCRYFKIITTNYQHFEYVQRDSDKNPILFYKHERAIEPILGNFGKLMLVDDFPATKSSNVYVIDLKTGKKWSIDTDIYSLTNHKLDTNNFMVFAQPIGFSPDDSKVLIKMPIGYLMSMDKEQQDAVIKKYGSPSYVVDSKTGKILHEYDQENLSEKWWLY
jgi:hypothetical protein